MQSLIYYVLYAGSKIKIVYEKGPTSFIRDDV